MRDAAGEASAQRNANGRNLSRSNGRNGSAGKFASERLNRANNLPQAFHSEPHILAYPGPEYLLHLRCHISGQGCKGTSVLSVLSGQIVTSYRPRSMADGELAVILLICRSMVREISAGGVVVRRIDGEWWMAAIEPAGDLGAVSRAKKR